MSSLSKSHGNMYPWVTHMWPPIVGCEYQCKYCYVKTFRDQPIAPRLNGDFPKLGKGKTIFVAHMCDMFARTVPKLWIELILKHCAGSPDNVYVFQSKNPDRFREFIPLMPPQRMLGTTIETNRENLVAIISAAPSPLQRARAMHVLSIGNDTFITIEPILQFDLEEFIRLIVAARPGFVNIGADSKGHNLPEPTREQVVSLIDALTKANVEIRQKTNLARLK